MMDGMNFMNSMRAVMVCCFDLKFFSRTPLTLVEFTILIMIRLSV